jgi:hypothetical protein
MLVSARGAAGILGEVGINREDARRLLLAGFAGPGLRTRGALLYDEERVRSLTTWPWLGLVTSRIERYGPMPFLATMCGYVAVGADVVAVQADESGNTSFTLTEPGAWFEPCDRRAFHAGAGRGCFIWGWPQQYPG